MKKGDIDDAVGRILSAHKDPRDIFKALAEVGLELAEGNPSIRDTFWMSNGQETVLERILGALAPWYELPENYNGDAQVTAAYFRKIIHEMQGA